MNEKVLHTLEYDKILEQLEALAGSEGGKRLCRSLRPFSEMEEILPAIRATSDAEMRLIAKGSLAFSGIRDVRVPARRAALGSSLSIETLLEVRGLLEMAGRAKNYGREELREEPDSLSPLFESLEPCAPLRQELDRCILSEDEIADSASPGLLSVRRRMGSIGERIRNEMNSLLLKHRSSLQDQLITQRGGRWCLPVKAEYRSAISGIVHDQSGTGSTVFVEPLSVVRLGNEQKELEIEEKREIEKVLAALSGLTGERAQDIACDYETLTRLDFIFAKARLSRSYKGTAPLFDTRRCLDIRSGRHPLLDPKKVVPISLRLGKEYDMLVVTGPNTGGKTVSLKTAGLFTLMGQAGLHIPAAPNSRLSVFKEVYADIGDEQSIEQSLSTFSSHMTNIVRILSEADEQSLVLFDELGAGTDPIEGAALARAILTRLHERGIRTMATTHYSELKLFALSTEGVENASCEFDVETLRPTYRLVTGVPGKSNAFAIAGKLGLPGDVIDLAGSYIDSDQEAFEDVIAELQDRRRQMEEAEAEIKELKEETARLEQEARKRQGALEAQKEKILREAREEARRVLQEAKDTADKAIRDLRRGGGSVSREMEQTRSGLREALTGAEDALSALGGPQQRRVTVTEKKLRVGDAVFVHSLGLKGTVSTLPDAKGNLFVQMGILRSQVNAADVELIPEETVTVEGKRRSTAVGGSIAKARSISPEINLIGMTVDEAVPALDKYLDDAVTAHLEKVRIIHGRGTGALRNAVTGLLRKDGRVASYETAPYNEGGYGATVATLKKH